MKVRPKSKLFLFVWMTNSLFVPLGMAQAAYKEPDGKQIYAVVVRSDRPVSGNSGFNMKPNGQNRGVAVGGSPCGWSGYREEYSCEFVQIATAEGVAKYQDDLKVSIMAGINNMPDALKQELVRNATQQIEKDVTSAVLQQITVPGSTTPKPRRAYSWPIVVLSGLLGGSVGAGLAALVLRRS